MTKPLDPLEKERRKNERMANCKEITKRTPEGRQRELLRMKKLNDVRNEFTRLKRLINIF